MSKKLHVIILILLVLVIDQTLKLLVKSQLMLEEEYPLLGNWLYLHFTENKGMAFGFQFAGVAGKYILSIIRIVAVIGIGWLIHNFLKRNISTSIIF